MRAHSVRVVCILTILASVPLDAQVAGEADDGPFARYTASMERLLDASLERAEEVRLPVPQPAREKVSESAASAEDRTEALREYAGRYWKGRSSGLNAALLRLARIRPEIERILVQEGVPAELSAVVLVESGADPAAISPKAARGLWQFIPATAARYGLVVSPGRDDRIDLARSTRAAARYLRDLYRTLGDWRLALAAYNEGESALRKAIEERGVLNFDLLSVDQLLPAETRAYVPAVIDAMRLLGSNTAAPREGTEPAFSSRKTE
ncbi:MAG: lytic transglycosylase domain-containing protein [Acidobacteriota bacterium]|nr:lytic transglycosylase domain-containing protein [Acidobacteriota bacterium]